MLRESRPSNTIKRKVPHALLFIIATLRGCGRNIFYKRHGHNQESAKFVRRHSLNVCKTYGYFSYLCRIGKYFADDMLENGKRLALSRFRNLAHSIRIGIGVQTFTHAVYAFAIYRSSVGNVALSYPWVCQNL